jgi:hypothetical protein
MMSMHAHFKTDTTSFANSFLLLAMVAGVLNIDLLAHDAVSGYNDHEVRYRIELVLNAEGPSQSPVLFNPEGIPGNDVAADCILPSCSHVTCFATALFVIQNTGQVSTRSFYSSHDHSRSFNIPHQNSDEDEALILPADVA